jgi:hypothetical protein
MPIPSHGMTFLLTILLLAGGRVSVAAQEVPSTFPDFRTSGWNHETLSVTDRSATKVRGRVLAITDNAITLVVHGQPRSVDASNVARITRRRAHTGRGALIGLLVGSGLGISTGLYGHGAEDFAIFWGAMLGGLGGGVGAGVGAAIHSEQTLYASSGAR